MIPFPTIFFWGWTTPLNTSHMMSGVGRVAVEWMGSIGVDTPVRRFLLKYCSKCWIKECCLHDTKLDVFVKLFKAFFLWLKGDRCSNSDIVIEYHRTILQRTTQTFKFQHQGEYLGSALHDGTGKKKRWFSGCVCRSFQLLRDGSKLGAVI